MRIKKTYLIALMCVLFGLLIGCKTYSFSGANVDPDLQSISITYFNNNSGNGPPYASDQFTQDLKEKMLNNTNLDIVNSNGDVQFSGAVVGYTYTVQAPTGNETSDLRRITMTVDVQFDNFVKPDENWRKNFSAYADYPVSESLDAVEESIIDDINQQIIDKIFNEAFVKW